MMMSRRSLLASAAVNALLVRHARAFILRGGAGSGGGGGGGPTALATLTVVNDGGGTQNAGVPTQSFGWLFKKGDIPAGTAPQFQVSGVAQPFSASVTAQRRYHDDGSLMWAAFALRPTFSLGAGASQAVSILSGGTWPSASSRTLTEVYAANLVVSCPVAPITGNGFSTTTETWGAWCKNDANLISTGAFQPAKDMDGDAGARWQLNVKMAQTQGGTAHGQMIFNFNVWALNDSAGTLGGFRWSGYVRQPYYNLDTPAKSHRVFATPDYVTPSNGVNWSATGVSATPLGWKGGDNNPMLPLTFTSVSGGQTSTANNYYFGSSANGQAIPCYFTNSGGALPTGITAGQFYMALAFTGSQNMEVYADSNCNPASKQTLSGGTGTTTIHPVPVVTQFTRLGFRSDQGRYLFFQGGGSITTETALRSKIDRSYWLSTGVIPPFDYPALKSIPDGGAVSDTGFSNLWNPLTMASTNQDESAAGDHVDIGMFPNEAILDFFNQNANTEKAVRCIASKSCLAPLDFRVSAGDATNGSLVNLSNVSYGTTMQAPSSTIYQNVTWQGTPGTANGFTSPPFTALSIGLPDVSTEHKPQYAAWAWLRFGEPEYWHFLSEAGQLGLLQQAQNRRNMGMPNSAIGVSLGFDVEYRRLGWARRDVELCATLGPYDPANPTTPGIDGTQATKYYIDIATRDCQRVVDIFNPANAYFHKTASSNGTETAYMTGDGTAGAGRKILALYDEIGSYLVHNPEWEYAFIAFSYCWAHARGDANAAYCMDTTATRWNYYKDQYGNGTTNNGNYNLFAYYQSWGKAGTTSIGTEHTGPRVASKDTEFYNATPESASGTISWDNAQPASSAFQFVGVSPTNSWSVTNGDYCPFETIFPPVPTAFTDITTRGWGAKYIVNWNPATQRFGLATTPGGAAISPGSTSSNGFGCTPNGAPPMNDWSNRDVPFAIGTEAILIIRTACCWMKARKALAGTDTGNFDAQIADINRRLLNAPGGPYSTVTAGPGGISDVRYAVKASFT